MHRLLDLRLQDGSCSSAVNCEGAPPHARQAAEDAESARAGPIQTDLELETRTAAPEGLQALAPTFWQGREPRGETHALDQIEDQARVLIENAAHITLILEASGSVRYVSPV